MATWPDPRSVVVSMAFGYTLRDSSPSYEVLSPGTGEDDPGPVLGPVAWERGRIGDAPETGPTRITFALRDDDGEFSRRNVNSPRYGTLKEGLPTRLAIDFGSGPVTIATAGAQRFAPIWDGEDDDGTTINPRVPITALGILQQIGRDTEARSAARLTLPASGATSLWLLESSLDSGLPGGTSLSGTFVDTDGPLGTAGAMDMTGSVALSGSLAVGPGGSSWRFGFAFKLSAVTGTVQILTLSKNGLPYIALSIQDTPGSEVLVSITLGASSDTATFTAADLDDGEWHTIQLVGVSDGGSLLDLFINIDDAGADDSGITVAHTSPDAFRFFAAELVGLSCITNYWVFDLHQTLILGLATQDATNRFETVLTALGLLGLADTGSGDSDPVMGRLPSSTAMAALRAVEDATEGAIFENADGTIALQLLDARYNTAVAATFAWADIPGSDPLDDDRDTYNVVTATDVDGNFAIEKREDGPVGTDTIGARPLPITRNLDDPGDLRHHAGWVLSKGTVDRPRFVVYLDLYANPDLAADFVAIDIGSRIQVTGAPARHVGPDALDLVVEGIRGRVMGGSELWVELHCQPYEPYRVQVLAEDDPGDDDPYVGWLEFDTCELASGVDADDTSWSMTCDPADTSDADDFPRRHVFAGEHVTVTASTGGTSPTWTVTRSVNGAVKAHDAGTSGELLDPIIPALA